jgi:ABC-type transporter Mla MlaB component
MKTQALHYYMHDGPTTFRFELSGKLDREGAGRLDQDWRTASSVLGDRRLIVDLTFVTSVDEEGRALLAGWHREGALLVANSKSHERSPNRSCASLFGVFKRTQPPQIAPGSPFRRSVKY